MSLQHNHGIRDPTATELAWIQLLMSVPFPGRDELEQQLRVCRVRPVDAEGSLELRLPANVHKAAVKGRVPVELAGRDTDGVGVHVLLHVVDGLAVEIEVFKASGTEILQMPKDWEVSTL